MNVEKILPFSLPEFKEQRHFAAKKISISGMQPKYSLKEIQNKVQKIDDFLENSALSRDAVFKYKDYVKERIKMLGYR